MKTILINTNMYKVFDQINKSNKFESREVLKLIRIKDGVGCITNGRQLVTFDSAPDAVVNGLYSIVSIERSTKKDAFFRVIIEKTDTKLKYYPNIDLILSTYEYRKSMRSFEMNSTHEEIFASLVINGIMIPFDQLKALPLQARATIYLPNRDQRNGAVLFSIPGGQKIDYLVMPFLMDNVLGVLEFPQDKEKSA